MVQAAAQVVFARDAVTADRKPLQAGMKLSEDALIETGVKGAVTLAFDDGTRVTVPPGSRVTLARVRSFARTGLIDVRLQVKQGEVESIVAPRKTGVGRYEISTPALVTGVRGTRFRVGAAGDVSTESVLEGEVAVRAGRQAQAVGAGFGVRAAGGRLKRVALPAAPKLDAVPELVQVPCFRPTWQPVKGAVAYRAMIARDPEQTEILSYQLSQTPAATLCGDEDGTYTLAVQSVDALGLSGPSATRPFTVRLHPEAPYMIQPASDKPYRSGEMIFAWASVAEAATYDLEAAGAPDFAQPAVRQHGQEVRVTQPLRPGTWWWRVRSVDKDGKTGPWSDAVRFRALDISADSVPPPSADAGDDGMLHAHWRALDPALADAGARTRVQLAAEPTFAKPVADLVSAGNEAMIPLPPAGPYYIRTGIDLGDAASVVFARPQRIDIGSFVVDAQGASVQSGGASLLLDERSRKAGPDSATAFAAVPRPGLRALLEWMLLVALAALLTFGAVRWSVVARLDVALYDAVLSLHGHAPRDDIVIVAIDDQSLEAVGRWPWPRARLAELVMRVGAAHPRAVGVDILLIEPDLTDPEGDRALAAAFAQAGHVILPALPERTGQGRVFHYPFLGIGTGVAHIDAAPDPDSVVRGFYLAEGPRGHLLEHLALQLARQAASVVPAVPRRAEIDADGWTRQANIGVNFAGPAGTFRHVPALALLQGQVPADAFAGKLVLIGATASGVSDIFATPTSRTMSGVEVLANATQTLLEGNAILPAARSVFWLVTLLPLALTACALLWLTPRMALAAALGSAMVLLVGVVATLAGWSRWLPPFAALVGPLVLYPLWSWRQQEAALRFLRDELKQLAREPGLLADTAPLGRTGRTLDAHMDAVASLTDKLRGLRRFLAEALESLPDATVICTHSGRSAWPTGAPPIWPRRRRRPGRPALPPCAICRPCWSAPSKIRRPASTTGHAG